MEATDVLLLNNITRWKWHPFKLILPLSAAAGYLSPARDPSEQTAPTTPVSAGVLSARGQ
jgi:hypothetical protein